MPHYRAAALSVDRLVTAWNATPLLTKSASTRYFPPSVADILELDVDGCSATPTHNKDLMSTAAHSPTPPSGPPSGPNIVEWLENPEKSPFSGAKTAGESAVEAEVDAETPAKTPEIFSPTNNESSAHAPSSNASMYVLFLDLRREMERLDGENEQLRQQVADAVATAAAATAARLDVEKKEESRIKTAIQRAEKAEKEKDEMIDSFIRVCIQHSANDRRLTDNPSHECLPRVNLRKKNLSSWLSYLPTEETGAITL